MKENNFWKIQYSPVIEKLAGSYEAYDIYTLSKQVSATGRKFYIDSVKYGQEVKPINTQDTYTLKSWASGDKSFENFKKTFPNFIDIERCRRPIIPQRISAGASWKDDEEAIMLANAHPQSDYALNIITTFRRTRAIMFLRALAEASVYESEVKATTNEAGEITAINDVEKPAGFPDEQKHTTYEEGYISVEDLTKMQSIAAKKMADGKEWFVVVSPTQKMMMINENIDRMFSKDFVEGGSLETGTLPKFMNFTFISHPLMELPEFAGKFFAFTKDAIVQANFSDVKFNVAPSPLNSFEYIMQFEQNVAYKRRDDGLVIQGTIKGAGEAQS